MSMRAIIKIGTAAITNLTGGGLDKLLEYLLVQQICILKQERQWEIALVTSGAVGAGKTSKRLQDFQPKIPSGLKVDSATFMKQVFAGTGQAELISDYFDNFRACGDECAQALVTQADFHGPHQRSLAAVTMNQLWAGITPVLNTNDILDPNQLGFTDNDQLAYEVAKMVKANLLVILTDVDGVYDRSPNIPGARVIREITNVEEYLHCLDDYAGNGAGGMRSKIQTAGKAMASGIEVVIANGKTENILLKIARGDEIGTHFPARTT